LTGQSVLSIPALTAFTRARLSFDVRPLTEGTVTGGSLTAESLPSADVVLEAVLATGAAAATGTSWGVDDATIRPSVGIDSPPGEGRASLLAAHPSAVANENMRIMGIDDLWETYCISSMEELLIRIGNGIRAPAG
jgi:hypothetical protein